MNQTYAPDAHSEQRTHHHTNHHLGIDMPASQTPVEVSRHKCLIYDGHPSVQLPVVIPFLAEGLHENWRCLYLGSPEMARMVDRALAERGVDTAFETRRGALLISSSRDGLGNGSFNPDKLVDHICFLIDAAVHDGFQGLCASGDMRWELGTDGNFDQLLEYEARLESIFHNRPLRGICQYHRDVLPARAVRQALLTHRSLYIGGALNRDNLYYIPPELLLDAREGGESGGSRQGEWMCQQLLRVLSAEESRDKALNALKESELHQRQLATQLAEANRDLERRVAERTADLRLANQHLEAFSYSVSHDLRSPLGTILGSCELLESEPGLGERSRKHLDRIASSALRMRNLIEGLLALARVAKTNLRRVPVDLSALAEEVVREIRETEPQRAVEIAVDGGLRAIGDSILLRAVLVNLVNNAWKFTSKREDARIEVGKTRDTGEEVFFVRDNGAGFDMKSAHKLFDAFQRLHRQDEFPGTGVGLATVQRIITKHGGRIWAEGAPGRGRNVFLCAAGHCLTRVSGIPFSFFQDADFAQECTGFHSCDFRFRLPTKNAGLIVTHRLSREASKT